jgi:hypothetical protein
MKGGGTKGMEAGRWKVMHGGWPMGKERREEAQNPVLWLGSATTCSP